MKIIYKEGEGKIEEKKSRFIAHVYPVQSEEQAVSYINEVKRNTGMQGIIVMPMYWERMRAFSGLVTMESRRGQQENRFLTLL